MITYRNVGELVLADSALRKRLPEFRNEFELWSIARSVPELRAMAQRCAIDFLGKLGDEHVKVLEGHFGDEVRVRKIDSGVLSYRQFPVEGAEDALNAQRVLNKSFFVYRDGDQLYISFWK